MIKRTFLVFLAAAFTISFFSFKGDDISTTPRKQKVVKTIVIDPGHGGSDAGAKGQYSYEKDICLDVSLKLGKMIEKEFPDIKLLFTRTTDTYPALHARADYANNNKGDLFLCIHVNSAPAQRKSELTGYKTVTYYTGKGKNRKKKTKQVPQYRYYNLPSKAKGTETYIWGAHKSEEKELAVRENAPMLAEENFEQNYGGIDPNSPEFIALSLLKTKQYFKRSATLAGYVQDEFVKVGRVDRDVKQRGVGIWVLQATAMPSVLIETGFISNPEEEKYLNSQEGQNELSECIIRALRKYISWLEEKQEDDKKEVKDDKITESDRKAAAANTKAFLEMVEANEKKRQAK
ncbi:MAG TPA: N-acetylmuramoyl-L-alanine amidase [Chitinophagaceae bacterium]|nr:N-acetylmuramoyl-L-alanine amidase [Chitinophagaceae bacterium]HQV86867.1 N-acetylmuramoyl-L-alanine amidase [Chitinophagaceae bacterium]HQX73577.1 N-acetylmuramoyl-L-alanine amidase [Chitinophagaceae bacterium]HQZ75848.1 N-acetylmuramoyl-L-alanine amidase [Chitinophagaceae bacterium]